MQLDHAAEAAIRHHEERIAGILGRVPDQPIVGGLCTVCGRWSLFSVAWPFREALACANCYATSRYRRMALGVLRALKDIVGVEAPTLTNLPRHLDREVRVLDTQTPFFAPPYVCYSIPERLSEVAWIDVHTSSYRPHLPWGADLGGNTSNQNLEQLTFEDGMFDIVMTSDVMEHVRLYQRAHGEIARVIKPGGAYVFTVPHSREVTSHLVRVSVPDPDDPTKDEFLLPPEYHGTAEPGEGPVLSYRVFGTEIDSELRALGFDVDYTVEPSWQHAIFSTELFYCRMRTSTLATSSSS